MMSFTLRLILCVLASFRIAQLIALDDGPIYIFDAIRRLFGRMAAGEYHSFKTSLADLFHCPYCVGIWSSALMIVLLVYPTVVGDIILLWLGISGAQAWLQGIVEHHE